VFRIQSASPVYAVAKLLCGGRRELAVVIPTVLTDTARDMEVEADETFGPVLTVNA
jgi:acyl-CoA reductase-like NAD-dependent aldehyde dehydrogenase